MKANTLLISAFATALAAIALLPISATAASLAITATGIMTILFGDYSRNLAPVGAQAPLVPFGSPGHATLAKAA